ncbi:MAG: SDR family oxidoreductase [Planctomycetes bacterium]|nr:SDR family oxidoreductase [Planctomycetota bacterium]
MQLSGKTALVTGAGRRVGRAIALRLARAGCDVAVHFHKSQGAAERTAAECQAAGARASVFCADLADAEACRRLVREVVVHFGRFDILINNASIFEAQSLDEFSLEDWERHLRINLTAPMVLVYEARDALRQARGRVVNLCDAANAHPWPTHLAYVVSKGALDTLTQVLARALAPDVNVVGIAPGVADWPEMYDAATRARLLERIPLRRAGTPEDIAAAVHFVLAEGDYITGAILPIDGGRRLA